MTYFMLSQNIVKKWVTDDINDSGMVTVVTNQVSNDNSISQHYVWWTLTTATALTKKKDILHSLLQRIVTVSYNVLTFHYYATGTFLLYAMACFLMFTDRANACLFGNNVCAILLPTS
jgi:hypothetical protein